MLQFPDLSLADGILALEVLLQFYGFSHRLLKGQRLTHALRERDGRDSQDKRIGVA